jgi:transcriptional regulator with XRE-family HTH domain
MDIGERIREKRKLKKLTQDALAQKIGVIRLSVIQWESGKAKPAPENLSSLAEVFGCTVDYLLTGRPEKLTKEEVSRYIDVPVLHPAVTVCAGEGFRLEDVLFEAQTEKVPDDDENGRNGELSSFLVKVEGDSMTGIPDGARLFCNPNEEIRTGDCAVCCVDGKWLVRGIVWRRDGSVELRAANGEYETIEATREDLDSGWAKILAKVMWIKQAPPRFI